MYLLNLLFDPADPSGRFASCPRGAPPLGQSQVWLELVGPDPADPTNFNPEDRGVRWKVLGKDDAIRISRGSGAPPFVAVRIAPLAGGNPTATLQAVATFGREPRAPQHSASPFTLDDTPAGGVCAVFNLADATIPAGQCGWYFPLKPISIAPDNPAETHKYEFTIGAIYGDGAATFGHDPQMDVSL